MCFPSAFLQFEEAVLSKEFRKSSVEIERIREKWRKEIESEKKKEKEEGKESAVEKSIRIRKEKQRKGNGDGKELRHLKKQVETLRKKNKRRTKLRKVRLKERQMRSEFLRKSLEAFDDVEVYPPKHRILPKVFVLTATRNSTPPKFRCLFFSVVSNHF